jgi:hypothetical protein
LVLWGLRGERIGSEPLPPQNHSQGGHLSSMFVLLTNDFFLVSSSVHSTNYRGRIRPLPGYAVHGPYAGLPPCQRSGINRLFPLEFCTPFLLQSL